ncbi:MAG: aminoglycoside phosphotransferase family protein [Myxococcota bacterium]
MTTEALVRERFGPVVPLLDRGLANIKFRADGALVRVNEAARPDVALGRFRKAAFCTALAEGCGVPVARVLEVGTLANGRPYSLEAWVDAEPADLVTDPARRDHLWHDLGAAIRTVHAAPLDEPEAYAMGFDGEGPTETWAAHLEAVLPALEHDRALGLTVAEKTRFVQRLLAFDLDRHPPGVCHGDLKLDNVLIRGDTLAAVLDWELARYVPAAPGEFSTTVEPAVLPSKVGAVARTRPERDAFRAGLGAPDEHDLWTFYLSDVATNLHWYPLALAARPDAEILRVRFERYLAGVRDDLAALT